MDLTLGGTWARDATGRAGAAVLNSAMCGSF